MLQKMTLKKKNKKLTALDLFSGIGGLALSLLPIFEQYSIAKRILQQPPC